MQRLPSMSPATYRRVTLVALVALVFIIVTGGAVRLTGSGLGCSDWPGCTQDEFVAPLELHPMVEWVNRLITGVVSVAVALAVLGSLARTPRRRNLTWLSLGLVAGVLGQIVLGGLTVLFELAPPFVMGHFLLSLALVANAVVLHHRAGTAEPADTATGHTDRRGAPVHDVARRLTLALAPAAAVAVITGTIVTATGPHGGDEDARRFGFAIESVARVHSLAVVVFLALVLALVGRLTRDGGPPELARRARHLLAVGSAQAVLGWVQYFTDVPVLLVGLHIFGATLVWIATCRVVLAVDPSPVPAAVPLRQTV
ncbi:MAG: COX15/CtaA family protein [Jiangellaceae bacterium]